MISDAAPSATSLAISTPRLMGPGCSTTTSGVAPANAARVRQKYREYSSRLGR